MSKNALASYTWRRLMDILLRQNSPSVLRWKKCSWVTWKLPLKRKWAFRRPKCVSWQWLCIYSLRFRHLSLHCTFKCMPGVYWNMTTTLCNSFCVCLRGITSSSSSPAVYANLYAVNTVTDNTSSGGSTTVFHLAKREAPHLVSELLNHYKSSPILCSMSVKFEK